MKIASKLQFVKDGFKNILKGLGSEKDPRENNIFVRGVVVNRQLAEDLYVYNWLCAKVVDVPVDDATRKWRNILISDADKKQEVEDVMKEFDVKGKFNLAMKWGRVFGGSVILIIIDGDDQEEPLDIERIRPDTLKNLIVLDRYNIIPNVIDRDILSENFGQPETYTVVRGGQQIHHTRLIKFTGVVPTIQQAERNQFWGLSLFTKLWEPISESQSTTNSIAALIYESNVDVYRINELNSLVAEGRDEVIINRLQILHKMKSMINGIVLDKEDEYDKKKNSFANLDEIDDRFVQKVAGAADMPVTKLVGISPAGMNSTGESDMRNYYDGIQSIQENVLRPKLGYLDKIILASAFGTDELFEYAFHPLQQVSEGEQSDIDLKIAQRDQIYLDNDVIMPTDAMAQLAENGTYITMDENRVEEEKQQEELFGEEEETEIGQPSEEPEGTGEEIPEGVEQTGKATD